MRSWQRQKFVVAAALFLLFYGAGFADQVAIGQDEVKQVRAQQTPETATVENAEATIAADAKSSQPKRLSFVPEFKPEDVRPHVEYLASDDLRGRRGAGGRAAARYVEDHFRKLKLLPLFDGEYLQEIPGQ